MDKCRRKVHWAALISDNHIPSLFSRNAPSESWWQPGIDWVCSENLWMNPAGSLPSVEASQNTNLRTVDCAWSCLSHSLMKASCVLVSVMVRAHCISGMLCVYPRATTELPFLFSSSYWAGDILLPSASRTLLPLFSSGRLLRHEWRISVDPVVPLTPCSAALLPHLQTRVGVWWLRVSRGRGLSRARGPYKEEWIPGRDIWQQEVDPVNEVLPLGLIRAFIRLDSGSATVSVSGDSNTLACKEPSLGGIIEGCEFHKLLSWASSVDLTCWCVSGIKRQCLE